MQRLTCKGGPGPSTAAYRLARASRPSIRSHQPLSYWFVAQSGRRLTHDEGTRYDRGSTRSTSSFRHHDTIATLLTQASSQSESAGSSVISEPELQLFLLPAPRHLRPIERILRKLVQACKDRSLYRVIGAWREVREHDILDDITVSHFENISACLVDELEGSDGGAFLMGCQPDQYGLLKDMAMAAAASQQVEGLDILARTMLTIGRPGDVLTAWEDTKDNIRGRLGIRKADLSSWDRETRLKARLPGEWISLLVTSIAALTMLDSANASSVLNLFDTETNLDDRVSVTEREIRKTVRVLGDITNTDRQLVSAFSLNISRARTAMFAYHPAALLQRIRDCGSRRNTAQLLALYRLLVAACTDPDPLIWVSTTKIQPIIGTDLFKDGIPILPDTWTSFCSALGETQSPECIRQLILEDLPRLMPFTPPAISSSAIMALLRMYTRRGVSVSIKNEARDYAEEILRDLARREEHMHPATQAARIDLLSSTGRLVEVRSTWAEALAGRLGRVERRMQVAFISHFVASGDPALAVSVFSRGLDGQHFDPPCSRTYATFFRRLMSTPLPLARKLLYAREVLALQPPDIVHDPSVFGSVALLEMMSGKSPEKSAQQAMARMLANSGSFVRPILECGRLLEDLMRLGAGGRGEDGLTSKRLRAGRQILTEIAESDVFGQSAVRLGRIWGVYLHYIVTTEYLTMDRRRTVIADALAAWPVDKFGSMRPDYQFSVVENFLKVPDDGHFDEGMARWYQMKRERFPIMDWHWLKVLLLSIQHKQRDAALRLATEALDERAVPPRNRRFWDAARADGLVQEAGLEGQLFLWQREGGQIDYPPEEAFGTLEDTEEQEPRDLDEEGAENVDLE